MVISLFRRFSVGWSRCRGERAGPLGWVLLVALLALPLVTGCGFTLRGMSEEIPTALGPLFVEAATRTATGRALIERLRGSQVALAEGPAAARVVVRIQAERRSSRVTAVDRNGKVLAYDLGFHVRFDALGAQGTPLLAAHEMTLLRTLDNPDIEVLGKQEETEMLYQDMHREAADRLLMQLRAALRQAPAG